MGWEPIIISEKELNEFASEFKKRPKFYTDENLSIDLVSVMQELGFNILTAKDAGLVGQPDENQLAYAHKTDRVLVTHDMDFWDNRRFPPHTRNPGILILPGGEGSAAALARGISVMRSLVGRFRELWRDSKVKVDSDGVISIHGFDAERSGYTTTMYRMTNGKYAEIWVK